MRRWKRTAGYTAVETAVAAGIMLFIAGGAVSVMKAGTDSWDGVRTQTTKQGMVQDALHTIIENMQLAINVTIDKTNPDQDVVTYQVPVNRDTDGTVEYGAFKREVLDGKLVVTPKKGFWTQLTVKVVTKPSGETVRKLVLRALDSALSKKIGRDEVLAKHVDRAWSGRKGFQIAESSGIYSISIRVKPPKGKRTEAKSSASREQIDLTAVDDTANDITGLDTTQLSMRIAQLESLVAASQGQPYLGRMQSALDRFNNALASVNADLGSAMNDLTLAVKDLEWAVSDGLKPADANPLMDGVATIGRQFATDAIAQAAAQDASAGQISQANSAISTGDTSRSQSNFWDALFNYEWAVDRVL